MSTRFFVNWIPCQLDSMSTGFHVNENSLSTGFHVNKNSLSLQFHWFLGLTSFPGLSSLGADLASGQPAPWKGMIVWGGMGKENLLTAFWSEIKRSSMMGEVWYPPRTRCSSPILCHPHRFLGSLSCTFQFHEICKKGPKTEKFSKKIVWRNGCLA